MNEIPRTYKGKALTHAWTYPNAEGEALGVVGRYDDGEGRKDMVPYFKPNGAGWSAGGPEAPAPLFGLDVLARRPDRPVLVVEGEKCAAALQSTGFVAVTSPGGSNAAHKADWKALEGRERVYLLPDNDTPGIAYARTVAGILRAMEPAPKLSVVDLPGLPPKGDVVDWIQARCPGWDGYAPVPKGERKRIAGELLPCLHKGRAVPPEWGETAQDEPIPPLVPLDTFELPPFEVSLLPGCLGKFSEALAAHTETPLELPAAMALSAVAAAVQGRFRIMVRPGYFEPLNLWLLTALPSGNRKSAVVEAAIAPLLDWERAEADRLADEIRHAEQDLKIAEAKAESLRKAIVKTKPDEQQPLKDELYTLVENMPEVPRVPILVGTDITPEHLGTMLADNNERMAWLSSEGGVFDILAGRYSRGIPNLDIFLKAHSGDHERVGRGSRGPVYLRHPALTMGLSPQPEVLRGLVDKPGFRGRGLLARFLYLLPRSPLGYRTLESKPVPKDAADEYAGLIKAILSHEGDKLLRLSPDAYRDWFEFALYIESGLRPDGEYAYITDWAGKLPGEAARIAGNLHVAKHARGRPEDSDVDAETMGSALELAAVFSRHALAAFDLMGADSSIESAKWVWDWVEKRRIERFTGRECWQALKGRFSRMAELNEALAVLVERGYLDTHIEPRTGPGRKPSPVYLVREEIIGRWA